MERSIDNRYLWKQFLMPAADGTIFLGTDLSLKRDVWLYKVGNEHVPLEQNLKEIGAAAQMSHPNFIQILDAAFDNEQLVAVLQSYRGQPLLHMLHNHPFTPWAAFSIVLELGKAMLDALEEGFHSFSIMADNLWLFEDGTPLIVNFWSRGENEKRGALGLTSLLYQLCTQSEVVPAQDHVFDRLLRQSLADLSLMQQETVISWIRRVRREQEGLSSFVFHLQEFLAESRGLKNRKEIDTNAKERQASEERQTAEERATGKIRQADKEEERSRPAAHDHEADYEEDEEEEDDDEDEGKSFFSFKKLLFGGLIAAVAVFFAVYWISGLFDSDLSDKASENRSAPKINQPDNEGKDTVQDTNPDGEEADSETAPTDQVEPGKAPRLIGLSKEQAEKNALAAGLHYKYFVETSDQAQNTVFKQDPEPNTPIAKGGNITFWVSRGTE